MTGRVARGRIAVVAGTRPELVALAPVSHELGDRAWPLLTGQHDASQLPAELLRSCGLPPLEPLLTGVAGQPRPVQVAVMLHQLAERFSAHRPAAVVVHGGTRSTVAAAQAAHYLDVPVVHVGAGRRVAAASSREEAARRVVSVLAAVHCAATSEHAWNLLDAGVDAADVYVTGSPVVEAVQRLLPTPGERVERVVALGLEPRAPFVLATVDRPENTDDPTRLAEILRQLDDLGRPVVLPAPPRTLERLAGHGLVPGGGVRLTQVLDYPTLLALAAEAEAVVSDSPGVQEAATVLRTPVAVVRPVTEHPEAVAAGFACLCEPSQLTEAVTWLLSPEARELVRDAPSPYGDGRAAERIAGFARELAGEAVSWVPAPREDSAPAGRLRPAGG